MKVFNIDGTEYAVESCTAICAADGGDESKRQDALLVSSEHDGEKLEEVVFGYEMPESAEAFLDICENYVAWEIWQPDHRATRPNSRGNAVENSDQTAGEFGLTHRHGRYIKRLAVSSARRGALDYVRKV